MYDVVIVGAGPAGSTLARLLGGRYRVLLADRRALDRPHVAGGLGKPCGGLLAPRAQAELARQGLGVPHAVTCGPQLFAVRTMDLTADLERLYQRFYVNVDREAFDRWLFELAAPCAQVATGWRATHVDATGEMPQVEFATPGGGRACVQARLVVAADGAGSIVRRSALGAAREPVRYVAVQARFRAPAVEPHYGAIFDAELTDFYGWTVPKADELLVGAAFRASAGNGARFDELLARLRSVGLDLGVELSREGASIARPSRPGHVAVGRGRIACVGEAAGLISPSSAEGISFALRSAARLAEACEPGLDGAIERYARLALPLGAEVCGKLAKASAIYGPATRRLVMRTGVGSIPVPRCTVLPGEAWCG